MRRQVRHLFNELAIVEDWHGSFTELGYHLAMLVTISALLLSMIALAFYLLHGHTYAGFHWLLPPLFVLGMPIGTLALLLLFALPLSVLHQRHSYLAFVNRLGYVWGIVVLATGAAAIYGAYRPALRMGTYWHAFVGGIAVGVLALLVAVVVALIYSLLSSSFMSYLERRKGRVCAQALAARSLTRALLELRRTPVARRAVFGYLRSAADRFDSDIPNELKTGDFTTDYWLGNRLQKISWTIRGMARRAVAPTDSTFAELQTELPPIIWATTMGYWALIDAATPDTVAPPQVPFHARLLHGVHAVTIGVLPLAGVAAVRRLGLTVPDYVAAGAVIWGLGAILLWLDPELKILSAFRQVKDAFQKKD
jgi:hypothetical protein